MVWANIVPLIFLCNVVSAVFGQHWLDCGLWVNIACIVQVIVLCNASSSRLRQHYVGYFPAKACLCDQGQYCTIIFRRSHQRCSLRKGVIRNFAKFTGGNLCQSFLFNKVTGLGPAFRALSLVVRDLHSETKG